MKALFPRIATTLACGALLMACQEYDLESKIDPNAETIPAIQVEPTTLDFWLVSGGERNVLEYTVSSVGDGNLIVDDSVLAGSDAFEILDDENAYVLEPGDSKTVKVAFSPLSPDEATATITIESDDPENPEVVVDLVGAGRVPRLEVTPEVHDFGRSDIPCGDEVQVTLQNVGNDNLMIDNLDFASDSQFAMRDAPRNLPLKLVPGAYTTLWVDWLPQVPGDTTATLTVESNDPRGDQTATQTGKPRYIGSQTDSFTAPVDPPVDILFAVDQSCSMDDDAVNLATNFTTFIDAIRLETGGWNLGVVTFDDGCFNHGILDANTANLDTLFTEAVSMGDDIEIQDDERLFKLADRALQQTGPGACNDGFLRPGAALHIIVVSDEPERSYVQASAWTWDYWVGRFETRVNAPSLLKVSGVVDLNGCNDGAAGYSEAIQATGGEALAIGQNPHLIGVPPDTTLVCDPVDWASYASTLAQASLTFLNNFPLSQDADAASVEVSVNSVPQTTGWTYDGSANQVVLDDVTPGSTIDVTYDLAATCP